MVARITLGYRCSESRLGLKSSRLLDCKTGQCRQLVRTNTLPGRCQMFPHTLNSVGVDERAEYANTLIEGNHSSRIAKYDHGEQQAQAECDATSHGMPPATLIVCNQDRGPARTNGSPIQMRAVGPYGMPGSSRIDDQGVIVPYGCTIVKFRERIVGGPGAARRRTTGKGTESCREKAPVPMPLHRRHAAGRGGRGRASAFLLTSLVASAPISRQR